MGLYAKEVILAFFSACFVFLGIRLSFQKPCCQCFIFGAEMFSGIVFVLTSDEVLHCCVRELTRILAFCGVSSNISYKGFKDKAAAAGGNQRHENVALFKRSIKTDAVRFHSIYEKIK